MGWRQTNKTSPGVARLLLGYRASHRWQTDITRAPSGSHSCEVTRREASFVPASVSHRRHLNTPGHALSRKQPGKKLLWLSDFAVHTVSMLPANVVMSGLDRLLSNPHTDSDWTGLARMTRGFNLIPQRSSPEMNDSGHRI